MIETPSISNGLSGETKHDDGDPRKQRDETPGYETVGEVNQACARSVLWAIETVETWEAGRVQDRQSLVERQIFSAPSLDRVFPSGLSEGTCHDSTEASRGCQGGHDGDSLYDRNDDHGDGGHGEKRGVMDCGFASAWTVVLPGSRLSSMLAPLPANARCFDVGGKAVLEMETAPERWPASSGERVVDSGPLERRETSHDNCSTPRSRKEGDDAMVAMIVGDDLARPV